MSNKKLRVIVLTHGGSERLLELLVGSEKIEIVGVFVEQVVEQKRSLRKKVERSIRYDGYRTTLKKIFTKLSGLSEFADEDVKIIREKHNDLEKLANRLGIPFKKVENYHDDCTLELLREIDADLGVIWGTNIIKESVFAIPKLGSINLHQGLAPIYRGGPTVFWELYNGEKEIGITIHYVAAQVDAGDIILQKTTPLDYDFSLYGVDYESFLREFRHSLVEPSAQLMANAVCLIAEGKDCRIKQDTSIGKRYRLPIKIEKDRLLRILRKRHSS